MSEEKEREIHTYDPYKKHKEFKWENPDELKNGPIGDETRKCRDCFCCIIFLIFILGCAFVAFLGFTKGKPMKLIYSYDEDGNACGHDQGYEDYPYLYFYKTLSNIKDLEISGIVNAICVKTCPNQDYKEGDVIKIDCKPTVNNTNCEMKYLDYYKSSPIINRFCFPFAKNEENFDSQTQEKIKIYDNKNQKMIEKIVQKNDIKQENGSYFINIDALSGESNAQEASNRLINWSFFSVDKLAVWMGDLFVTKYALAGCVLWSFILAMIFMLFLRCCAGFIIFLLIFVIFVGLIVLAIFFKMKSSIYKEQGDDVYETTMTILFWVFVAFSIIWLLFIIIMCNRIRLAIALIEVTAKYVGRNCCIVWVPFLFLILFFIWIAYWIILSLYLYASGDFDKNNSKVVATFIWDNKIKYSWWFHLFALLYIDAIISAYSQFVYSSSACIWYFTSERGTENHPIAKSFHRGLRYHFGSLAFGAIIIAIIRFIMFFLGYFKKKAEKTFGKKNQGKCFKCVMCCLECCLNCIGRTMEFINKHAYIQIAIKGDCFCTAAWEGFALLVRNLGRFSVLTLLGKVFTFIGTIFIIVSSAVTGFFVITKIEYFSKDLNSCILPVICFGLIGLIIGNVTMSIFGVSGDALMHSFLMDEELNKGQAKAFPELQKFMSDER